MGEVKDSVAYRATSTIGICLRFRHSWSLHLSMLFGDIWDMASMVYDQCNTSMYKRRNTKYCTTTNASSAEANLHSGDAARALVDLQREAFKADQLAAFKPDHTLQTPFYTAIEDHGVRGGIVCDSFRSFSLLPLFGRLQLWIWFRLRQLRAE